MFNVKFSSLKTELIDKKITFQTPVSFRVTIPKLPEKGEWKLNGQTLNLTLPLTDNVSLLML